MNGKRVCRPSQHTPLLIYHCPPHVATIIIVHSFIRDISIAPLQVHKYSEVFPTIGLTLCGS